jgi:lambda repressor-like predicted transcriptional regulator
MTLEEYRRRIGWSIAELARHAGIDYNTAKKALDSKPITPKTARSIAEALSQELGTPVQIADITSLNVNW